MQLHYHLVLCPVRVCLLANDNHV